MEYKKKNRRPQSELSTVEHIYPYNITSSHKKHRVPHIPAFLCVFVCVWTNLSEAVRLRNMAPGSRQWSRRLIGALLVRRLSVQMGCDLSSAQ